MATKGQWVKKPSRLGFENMPIWGCSICGKAFTFHPDYNYCPQCGADMRVATDINVGGKKEDANNG